MNRIAVSSSNVESVGYENGKLEIGMKDGRTYRYSNVPRGTYQDLMSAPSIGKFVHERIKNQFPTERIA